MHLPRHNSCIWAVGVAALVTGAEMLSMSVGAIAQELSRKTIRIVVPFPRGGGADVLARSLPNTLRKVAQSVVVENRAGAGSIVGTEAAGAETDNDAHRPRRISLRLCEVR